MNSVLKNAEPIFVVGLPRSGSTLVSWLINASSDIICVNDLYYIQAVLAQNAIEGPLNAQLIERLTDAILEVISARASKNTAFIGQIDLQPHRIKQIRRTVLIEFRGNQVSWEELMNSLLTRVAQSCGKTRWADKTPQNFMHIEMLNNAFPRAKFLFVFRNPLQILNSLKNATGMGHDRRRYHPVPYALYWRTAVRKYFSLCNSFSEVGMIRYEDLLSNLGETCDYLGRFLSTTIPDADLAKIGDNSSFKKGRRTQLLPTEIWICQKLVWKEMKTLGYDIRAVRPSLFDLPKLVLLTVRFLLFQSKRFLLRKDGRHRILSLVHQTLAKTIQVPE